MNPDFQRDFVWDATKQSKLIESIIMRIPLPVLYLAENEEGRMIVVDGLQRLSTFKRFVSNELKPKLPDRPSLDKKRFRYLAPKLRNRIEDCNLILYVIDQKVPEQAKLDIFDRVNSGVPLTLQQMRNSLYSGEAARFLKRESEYGIIPGCHRRKPEHLDYARPRIRQPILFVLYPGFHRLQQLPRTNTVVLGLRTSRETEFHRPTHTGFGLTQILPVFVAALSEPEGGILLVENPEVHLHPAGQALMSEFLADVARAGVQVIVETHSDHVLNGIRRAVKTGRLVPEQVAIHLFKPRSAEETQVHSPALDANGNIDV